MYPAVFENGQWALSCILCLKYDSSPVRHLFKPHRRITFYDKAWYFTTYTIQWTDSRCTFSWPAPVAYLGGGGACGDGSPPLGNSEKYFDEIHCYKWDFKPIYFSQKYPQNAENGVSETQISRWDLKPIYFAQNNNNNNLFLQMRIYKHFSMLMTIKYLRDQY